MVKKGKPATAVSETAAEKAQGTTAKAPEAEAKQNPKRVFVEDDDDDDDDGEEEAETKAMLIPLSTTLPPQMMTNSIRVI